MGGAGGKGTAGGGGRIRGKGGGRIRGGGRDRGRGGGGDGGRSRGGRDVRSSDGGRGRGRSRGGRRNRGGSGGRGGWACKHHCTTDGDLLRAARSACVLRIQSISVYAIKDASLWFIINTCCNICSIYSREGIELGPCIVPPEKC
jgi:hypothetical protein